MTDRFCVYRGTDPSLYGKCAKIVRRDDNLVYIKFNDENLPQDMETASSLIHELGTPSQRIRAFVDEWRQWAGNPDGEYLTRHSTESAGMRLLEREVQQMQAAGNDNAIRAFCETWDYAWGQKPGAGAHGGWHPKFFDGPMSALREGLN